MVFWTIALLAAVLVGYLGLALALVFHRSMGPRPRSHSARFAEDIKRPRARTIPLSTIFLRDGYPMAARVAHGPPGSPLLILLHGSGWHGQQLEDLALRLSDAATVVVPDLRGHGADPHPRGDIAYLGQIEDDLADVISRLQEIGQAVVLAGHSSGAGTVLRFCGGRHGIRATAAVLLAPYLRHDAPCHYAEPSAWADLMIPRLRGLEMLNAVGIHAFDHLPVVQFAMPDVVLNGPMGHTATLRYSYRLNASLLPRRKWWRDIAALPDFVLLAGTEDRAFRADRYREVFSAHSRRGRYHLLTGVGHPDVVHHPATELAFREVLDGCPRHRCLRGPGTQRRPGKVPGGHGRPAFGAPNPVPDPGLQRRGVPRTMDDP